MATTSESRRQDARASARAAAAAQQSEELRQRQAGALAQLDCLKGVTYEYLRRLAALSTLRAFMPGNIILDERAPSQFLYLILRGTIRLSLHDRAGHEVLIGFLSRGDCFGEGPLFGDQFRSASARAETACHLLQLPLAETRALLDQSPQLAAVLRAIYRQRLVASTLGRVPLFSQLTPLARAGVAGALRQQHYRRGELIIRQGAPGDALYLIESGQVVVEQGGQAIAHLDEGDFFGEMSLLTDQPHNADVRTLTPVDVLVLPAGAFRDLLSQQPVLATQLQEVVERRRAAGSAMRHDPTRARQLGAALDRGLLRGRHVLVRDPALCVAGCRICETACATRHGQTRIHLSGVFVNGLDVTDSCRQCRVGAECVEACPHDAIKWNNYGALIITDNCTGCGACVSACPYGAVDLLPIRQKPPSSLTVLWNRLSQLRGKTIPLEPTTSNQARASKCDLCHGYDDLACVSACPTGALRLAPVEEVFPL